MTDKCLKSQQQRQPGKASKHILERQRRARINHSLSELKNLVLSSLYHDSPEVYMDKSRERLDKAEILDLTVNFLRHRLRGTPIESCDKLEREALLMEREHLVVERQMEDPSLLHARYAPAGVCLGCVNGRCAMPSGYGPVHYGVPTPPPSPPTSRAVFFPATSVHHYPVSYCTLTPHESDLSATTKAIKEEPLENRSEAVWRPW